MIVKNLANIITCTRIIGSILLVFVEPLNTSFYYIYTYCGLSDVLDGYIARKTNTSSEFGSKLDSVSDLLFYTVMMISILPILLETLPSHTWYLIQITFLLRLCMYINVGIFKKEIMSNHTLLNKLTGLLVFFIPYMIKTDFFNIYALIVSITALVAALYELYIIVYQK